MPKCENCGTAIRTTHWIKICGEGMNLHVRCNGCGLKVRAHVPFYIQFPFMLFPIFLFYLIDLFTGIELKTSFIFMFLAWFFIAIPIGYHLLGRIEVKK
jgi:hypothetical protein